MINGPGRAYVERRGGSSRSRSVSTRAAIVHLVERVVAPLGLRLDRSSPMVDARLPDGSRLHAVIPPLAVDGPCVTIRRFGAQTVTLDDFGVDRHGRGRPRCGGRGRMEPPRRRGDQRGQDHAAQRPVAVRSRPPNASSPSRRRPSCGWRSRTWCGSKPDRPMPRVSAASTVRDAGASGAADAPRSRRGR